MLLRASRGVEQIPEFFSDEDRAQRNTLALREVDYGVTARLQMTSRAGDEDSLEKFRAMFVRRVEKGQQHYQPYLGCREFPATVEFWDGKPAPLADETRELGGCCTISSSARRTRHGSSRPGWRVGLCGFPSGRARLRARRYDPARAEGASVREGLVDDPAFESKPVPWIIVLDRGWQVSRTARHLSRNAAARGQEGQAEAAGRDVRDPATD